MKKWLLFIVALCLAPVQAQAVKDNLCDNRSSILTNASIAAGAVTSVQQDVQGYREIMLQVDLTDADNSVTNLQLTITDANSTTGQERNIDACSSAGGTLNCKIMKINHDPRPPPTGDGHNYQVPIPSVYQHIKITVTPTGHGALDAVTVSVRTCI